MPLIWMPGIALIIHITTAGHDSLMKVGLLLVLALFIHNVVGYTLGYWSGRLLKFSEKVVVPFHWKPVCKIADWLQGLRC
ncbi:MAG: hypothetical protein ABIR15_18510 [Chitinophagaceae bacterium]